MSIERVEGLHFIAVISEIECAVGEHAVYIKHGKFYFVRPCMDILHTLYPSRLRCNAVLRRLNNLGAEQVVHVQRADQPLLFINHQ